jgi:FtsH-binding integral membrane protein
MPWRGEKYEKHEKHEKREKGEKSSHGGMLGALVGGLVLIWLGITFYLEQNGNLPSDIWWAYFVVGVGAILILEGAVIFTRGHYGLGPVIGGAFLIFAGMSAIATNNYRVQSQLWPLAIVVIGILVLLSGFAFRRRAPTP